MRYSRVRYRMKSLLDSGASISIGSDMPAGDVNPFLGIAATISRRAMGQPEVLPPASEVISLEEAVRACTMGGAARLGKEEIIGSIEVGKRADLIQVAFDDVHHVPTYDVISHLVYVTDEQDVASVIVDGRLLMKERQMLTIETDRVAAEAKALAARIQAALETRNQAP